MKKIILITISLIFSISFLNADNHIKTNPITTPMEPEAFLGAYTEMILKMAEFQKEAVLMLKLLSCLLYPQQQV